MIVYDEATRISKEMWDTWGESPARPALKAARELEILKKGAKAVANLRKTKTFKRSVVLGAIRAELLEGVSHNAMIATGVCATKPRPRSTVVTYQGGKRRVIDVDQIVTGP